MRVSLNGKPAKLILDTGASKTAFDLEQLERFGDDLDMERNEELSSGLGTSSMESFFIVLDEFKIGDLVINDYEAVALDLGNINETYRMLGLEEVDGVLGSDILKEYQAVIDYKKEELRLFVDGRKKK